MTTSYTDDKYIDQLGDYVRGKCGDPSNFCDENVIVIDGEVSHESMDFIAHRISMMMNSTDGHHLRMFMMFMEPIQLITLVATAAECDTDCTLRQHEDKLNRDLEYKFSYKRQNRQANSLLEALREERAVVMTRSDYKSLSAS